jgi:Replication protein P
MQTGKELAESAARALAASSKTSPTAAGPTDPARSDALIDAINQVFTLFRLNYHNQYYSAFGDEQQLRQIKKLWLDSLAAHSPETILLGARHCIQSSEYLPTLHRMLESCREMQMRALGLPDAHAAYREACLAPEPKHAQPWSHPAVYHAGSACGWFLLASSPESKAFPIFERHYRAACERATRGDTLSLPATNRAPDATVPVPSAGERRAKLAELRRKAGI